MRATVVVAQDPLTLNYYDPSYGIAADDAEDLTSKAFAGWVREVRFSTSARYTEEFTPTWRFKPDADTVLLLHCDDGRDTRVRDSSGQHSDATFVNGWWWLLP